MKPIKKTAKAKGSVKLKDLGAKKNPKGGLKMEGWLDKGSSFKAAGWIT